MDSLFSKPKVLIDITPATGHFHAILKIVRKLQEAGYEVICGSHPYLQKKIENYGFQFVNIPEVFLAKINFNFKISRFFKMATFFYWWISGEKYLKSKKDIDDFLNVINKIEPDLVLLDEHEVLKSLLYESADCQVIAVQTMPDTRKIKGIPPFTSYYLPKGRLKVLRSSLLWLAKLTKINFNYRINRAITFGQDNFSVFKKIGKELGFDLRKRVDFNRSFGIGVKGIKRIVISPAAFDFPHPETKDVFRLGPLVDIKREGKIAKPRYVNLLKRLKSGEDNKTEFVVYCSLGTVTASFKKDITKFFKKIAAVAKLNPEFLFIISTGADFDTFGLFPTPNNLFVFDYVPQVELLQYCNLMITHGGMNSITECVYNYVPMLVYPLSPRWDQPGNSARVEYHKLGLRGKIKKDSVKKISKKVNRLKLDYKFYRKNVSLMKEKFEENNNSDRLLDLIESEIN